MVICPEYCFPYLIDSISDPVIPKYNWFYDSELNDFVLRPIRLIEETTGTTVRVKINGAEFNVPASWYLIICDYETKLIDTVPITQCSSSNFQAFLMHPEESTYTLSPVILLDLFTQASCVHVAIPRQHAILHPVGQIDVRAKSDKSYSCLLSPQDLGKSMNGLTAMEMLL